MVLVRTRELHGNEDDGNREYRGNRGNPAVIVTKSAVLPREQGWERGWERPFAVIPRG